MGSVKALKDLTIHCHLTIQAFSLSSPRMPSTASGTKGGFLYPLQEGYQDCPKVLEIMGSGLDFNFLVAKFDSILSVDHEASRRDRWQTVTGV